MGKKEDQLYAQIMNSLMPFVRNNEARSQELYSSGLATSKFAEDEIKKILDFYNNLETGEDRTKLLDFVDAESIGDEYDNVQRVMAELSPRGGRRASQLGNLDFDRMDNISDLLFSVRAKAPEAKAALAQALAGIGAGKLSGSNDQNAAILGAFNLGTDQFQRAQDRKTSTINSIIGGIGTALGFAFCFSPDTKIITNKGELSAREVRDDEDKGLRIICYKPVGGDKLEGGIISSSISFNEEILVVETKLGKSGKFTPSHYFMKDFSDSEGTPLSDIEQGDEILVYHNNEAEKDIITKIYSTDNGEVINFKLIDEQNNYIFPTNEFLSFDNNVVWR